MKHLHSVTARGQKLFNASPLGGELESAERDAPRVDNYSVEAESVRLDDWNEILQRFDDSSLMQTWSYGSIRWGEKNLSHVVLRKSGKIVAASQAIIINVPFLPAGLAYVKCGPCWQLKGERRDLGAFRQMLRSLYQIYVIKRGLLLRIFPNAVEDATGTLRTILEEEGFQEDLHGSLQRTVLLDLSHPLNELRHSLKGTWRRNLVLSERNSLTVTHGVGDDLFQELMILYEEMKARKKWEEVADAKYFQQVQRNLPAPLKMMCMICRRDGVPVSGAAVSKIGDTAVLLLSATGNRGLTLRSSYFLQWQVLKWLKSSNVSWYDLFGINKKTHPGTYQFKSGLAGRLGLESSYVGAFQAGNPFMTRLLVAKSWSA
ncbi:MAG: peptidoglycan bridge formation glycyltransferase FemA/FemB family protein [Acidobacteriota bacterium]